MKQVNPWSKQPLKTEKLLGTIGVTDPSTIHPRTAIPSNSLISALVSKNSPRGFCERSQCQNTQKFKIIGECRIRRSSSLTKKRYPADQVHSKRYYPSVRPSLTFILDGMGQDDMAKCKENIGPTATN